MTATDRTVDARLPHGSVSTYTNHGCRCADCRAANVEANAAGRLRRWEEMQCGLVSPPHGRESTYLNYMCRCDECRAEHARRDHERRKRLRQRRLGIARILVGLVLVGGSALGAFGHDARTPEPEVWLCQLDQPRCIAEMAADR